MCVCVCVCVCVVLWAAPRNNLSLTHTLTLIFKPVYRMHWRRNDALSQTPLPWVLWATGGAGMKTRMLRWRAMRVAVMMMTRMTRTKMAAATKVRVTTITTTITGIIVRTRVRRRVIKAETPRSSYKCTISLVRRRREKEKGARFVTFKSMRCEYKLYEWTVLLSAASFSCVCVSCTS